MAATRGGREGERDRERLPPLPAPLWLRGGGGRSALGREAAAAASEEERRRGGRSPLKCPPNPALQATFPASWAKCGNSRCTPSTPPTTTPSICRRRYGTARRGLGRGRGSGGGAGWIVRGSETGKSRRPLPAGSSPPALRTLLVLPALPSPARPPRSGAPRAPPSSRFARGTTQSSGGGPEPLLFAAFWAGEGTSCRAGGGGARQRRAGGGRHSASMGTPPPGRAGPHCLRSWTFVSSRLAVFKLAQKGV